jgi:catechol 2,3-dioxygenase-like lactoylglutathione lyase family enzyme
MSSISIDGVDFATVFVTDYPRATEFYGETLGLEHSATTGKSQAASSRPAI